MEDLPEYVMADILSAPGAHGFPECIFPFEDLPRNVKVDILSRLPYHPWRPHDFSTNDARCLQYQVPCDIASDMHHSAV
ncbi:hypothetical protein Tco_1246797 [Tanacetum coccineum]